MQVEEGAPTGHLRRGNPFSRDAIYIHGLGFQLDHGLKQPGGSVMLAAQLRQVEPLRIRG
jgi:hypothetical protein